MIFLSVGLNFGSAPWHVPELERLWEDASAPCRRRTRGERWTVAATLPASPMNPRLEKEDPVD